MELSLYRITQKQKLSNKELKQLIRLQEKKPKVINKLLTFKAVLTDYKNRSYFFCPYCHSYHMHHELGIRATHCVRIAQDLNIICYNLVQFE
ncbi:MAG: hypothetical protein K0R72_709 [Clostridia bacterium]|jgi:hypothetical protein|nr:hypothetical protein [Clostridia bacterium]